MPKKSIYTWPVVGKALRRAQIRPAFLTLLVFTLVLMFGGGVTYLAAIPGLAAESPLLNPISGAEESADMERLARALSKTSGSVADGASESPDASGPSGTDAAADASLPGGEGAVGEGDAASEAAAGASAAAGVSGLAPAPRQEGSSGAVSPSGSASRPQGTSSSTSSPGSSSSAGSNSPSGSSGNSSGSSGSSGDSQPASPPENLYHGSSVPPDTRYYPEGPEENGLSPEMEANIAATLNQQYPILVSWGDVAYGYWEEFNAVCMSDSLEERKAAAARFRAQDLYKESHAASYAAECALGKASGRTDSSFYACSKYIENRNNLLGAWGDISWFFWCLRNAWSSNLAYEDPSINEEKWRSEIPVGPSGYPVELEEYESKRKGVCV